ncbi:MAG TPA: zf-HC2 domain-containing protein [Lacunisphaera sp.]
MNCRDIESLIFAERDGVLTKEQHAALSAHIAACPACRHARTVYGEAVTFLKTDAANVAVPNVDKEWRTIRAQLHGEGAKPAKKRPLAPIIWFSAPLAAAAALAFAFFVTRSPLPEAPSLTPPAAVAEMASADFVEAGDANASTMVYVDKDSGWLVVWATAGEVKGRG